MKALLPALLIIANVAIAEGGPTEAQVHEAVEQARLALEAGDFPAWAQYFTEDSDIIMDMDPLPERGQRELDYDTFLGVGKISLNGLENPAVTQEIESLERDPETGDLLLTLVTKLESDLLGMRMEDVTRSETRYALQEDKLIVLSYSEEVLRAGPVQP